MMKFIIGSQELSLFQYSSSYPVTNSKKISFFLPLKKGRRILFIYSKAFISPLQLIILYSLIEPIER